MRKMDFSSPEPKPEIIKGLDQSIIDKNKQDLFKFFNISVKTKVATSVVAVGLVLFFVAIYSAPFNNAQLNTLYPKDQSHASQTETPSATPTTGTGFFLSGPQTLKVGNTLVIDVKVQSSTESAGVMAAQIRFDNQKLEVVGTDDTDSITKNWIDNNTNNNEGLVSLVANFPKGIQVPTLAEYAKVTFKVKAPGETSIFVDSKNSHIFRFSDKKELKNLNFDTLTFHITP